MTITVQVPDALLEDLGREIHLAVAINMYSRSLVSQELAPRSPA